MWVRDDVTVFVALSLIGSRIEVDKSILTQLDLISFRREQRADLIGDGF